MKPLPTLMRPLALGRPRDRRAGARRSSSAATSRRSRRSRSSPRPRSRSSSPRAAREKFGGDALGDFVAAHRAYLERIAVAHALDRHLALVGFMGAGKSTLGREVAERLGRPFVDLDARDRAATRQPIAELFDERGEAAFRELEEEAAARRARARPSRRCSRSAAAPSDAEQIREALRERALTVLVEVDADDGLGARAAAATGRSRGTRAAFRALYERAAAALRRGRGRASRATSTASCSPRPGSTSSAGALERLGRARRRRRAGRARRRRARARAPPDALGSTARRRTRSRAARRRRRSARSSGSGASCGSTATGRSSRSAAARRPTSAGFVAATYLRGVALGRGADDARRPGRRGDRRQDGDRPPGGQEPRRRVPLARARR